MVVVSAARDPLVVATAEGADLVGDAGVVDGLVLWSVLDYVDAVGVWLL